MTPSFEISDYVLNYVSMHKLCIHSNEQIYSASLNVLKLYLCCAARCFSYESYVSKCMFKLYVCKFEIPALSGFTYDDEYLVNCNLFV